MSLEAGALFNLQLESVQGFVGVPDLIRCPPGAIKGYM